MQGTVTFSQVNTELGVPSGTTMSASNTGFRNVANDNSGEINLRQVRRGLNFPGGTFNDGSTRGFGYYRPTTVTSIPLDDFIYNYTASPNLTFTMLTSNEIRQSACSNCTIIVASNGQIQYIGTRLVDGGNVRQTYTTTWLTSGAAGDYTAQLQVTGGTYTASSDLRNSDLNLGTTRQWTLLVGSSGFVGLNRSNGALVIKQAGTEIFRRPLTLHAEALGAGAPAPK
jgi:hypothetical protein